MMEKRKIFSICLVLIMTFQICLFNVDWIYAQVTSGEAFYVALGGNDSNEGTIDSPFASLEKARDVIRELKQSSGLPDGGVTVYLREGTYNFTDSFLLDERDSGTEEAPIVYKAYNNETVSIMGGYELDTEAFESVSDQEILNRLPEASKDKVVQIDLKAQGITQYGQIAKAGFGWDKVPPAPELFINNKTMSLGRYPNEGFLMSGSVIEQGFIPRDHSSDKPAGDPNHPDYVPREEFMDQPGPIFTYGDEHIDSWTEEDEIWLFGYWKWDWADDNLKVQSLNTETNQIEAAHPSYYGIGNSKRFYAYNLLCEIDIPGEWYLDRTNGMLYVYPETDIKSSTAQLSVLDKPLISMDHASNITIQDITFEISCGHGIKMMDCSNNLVADCTLRRLGQKAVVIGDSEAAFDGTMLMDSESGGGRNNGVVSCDIYETGAGGISIIGGDRDTLTPARNYAENNHIYDYARIIRTYTPAIGLNGVGNRASNNLIHNAPHMAIQFRGNDLIIENNEIYDVCQETADAGVIYSARDWTYRGNIIRDNYIHHISTLGGLGSYAIYLDDLMSSTEVTGNVFYKISNWVFLIGGGRDHIVQNNIMIDCGHSVKLGNRGEGWASYHAEAPNGTCYKTLINVPYKEEPWSSKYPELVNIWEDDPKVPKGNIVSNNVLYNTGAMSIASSAKTYGTIENNLTLSKDMDPGFIDPKNQNFELREDSIIFKEISDFMNVSMDEIGLKIDQYRTELPQVEIEEFNLISPEDQVVDIDPIQVELTWESAKGAVSYEVVVASDIQFNEIVFEDELQKNSISVTGLQGNTTYYWKVKAKDVGAIVNGERWNEGGIYQFTTQNPQYLTIENFELGLGEWEVVPGKGTMSVTTEKAYTGKYSYVIDEDMDAIEKELGKEYNETTASIMFYDTGSTAWGNNNMVRVDNNGSDWIAIGVDSRKGNNYVTRIAGTTASTSTPRSEGWHEFKWDYSSGDHVDLYIDGQKVKTTSLVKSFSYVAMGDWWQFNVHPSDAYFDYFRIGAQPTAISGELENETTVALTFQEEIDMDLTNLSISLQKQDEPDVTLKATFARINSDKKTAVFAIDGNQTMEDGIYEISGRWFTGDTEVTYERVLIIELPEITKTVEMHEVYELPKKVNATLNVGGSVEVDVVWYIDGEAVDGNADTSQAGTYIYEGKVEGTELTASLVLVVEQIYTVTFDSNGGTIVDSIIVTSGSVITVLIESRKDGYTFDGWYKDEGLNEVWNFENDTVETSITLYAKWITYTELTEQLIENIEEMNFSDKSKNKLISILSNALKSLERDEINTAGINQLKAFINMVEAQKDKQLTNEQAETLIIKAQKIISMCQLELEQ